MFGVFSSIRVTVRVEVGGYFSVRFIVVFFN